jgi:hypothetical protein
MVLIPARNETGSMRSVKSHRLDEPSSEGFFVSGKMILGATHTVKLVLGETHKTENEI